MDDRQIIGLFLARNEDAVAQTAAKYAGYCRTVALRILQCPEDAEEALNETWLAAWNSIPPHDPACLQTFLGRLTRNICLKRIRAEKATKRPASEARLVYDEVESWLASGEDVEKQITDRELADAIGAFLRTLTAEERHIFVRRYLYMQPLAEIAAQHGYSESKVKSMLFRLRGRLRDKLKKEGFL